MGVLPLELPLPFTLSKEVIWSSWLENTILNSKEPMYVCFLFPSSHAHRHLGVLSLMPASQICLGGTSVLVDLGGEGFTFQDEGFSQVPELFQVSICWY